MTLQSMLPKSKRWERPGYLKWIATLPCASCGIIDETIVPHHAIDISAIAGRTSSKGCLLYTSDAADE